MPRRLRTASPQEEGVSLPHRLRARSRRRGSALAVPASGLPPPCGEGWGGEGDKRLLGFRPR
ncbi:hypothetical protein ELI02_14140 [Rhizobium leguminosarum]|nr:hypothetical protein ELI22_14885 [Rhizobium leguminosarum]TAW36112.1 hypothetical protein ELI23_15085 [Rhizobium leguminosarum]TAX56572.1 hypothetical protein ELI01_15700 [Rhizobium leguminosarum]TAX61077.1 hypothetical protein ELI02_14140 [Rhizobium leguminosarum]TAY33735.1 hypothetical protein ELH93_14405 [Rhizobium leguminosarum]